MYCEETRKEFMGVLAKSSSHAVAQACEALPSVPEFDWLRRPEVGGVMVRGRMGGTGAPFNMGEMTVTRCTLKLATGQVGHSYVQGRDKTHAKQAALIDALMQTDQAAQIDQNVIAPLRAALQKTKAHTQARADQTKVDFFTVVRGED